MTKLIKLTLFVFTCLFFSQDAQGQCNPSYTMSSSLCENSTVSFRANAPGFSSYNWEFKAKSSGKIVGTSQDRDPMFAFTNAGTYTINLKASGVAGSCDKSIEVVIKESPKAKPILITPQSQCFKGNLFCLIDSSTPAKGSRIVEVITLFNDGKRYDADTPSIGDTLCHSFIDPKGVGLI